jgi:NAD(P)-dependent dehydrogenase (short-subunit alcohol dehydrogenase family)
LPIHETRKEISMKKTVLITGASTGIGQAAAVYFAEKGWNVIATMRQPPMEKQGTGPENILTLRLDVQDPASIGLAIQAGLARCGRIDALLNNAGFGLSGLFESIPSEKAREQFDVNVFGVMEMTRAILPHFREKGGGLILNVSSRGGVVGLPLMSLYCASKFALEGFSEALAYELASQKITVKIIAPGGGAATQFGQRLAQEQTHNQALPDYDGFMAVVAQANARFAGLRQGFSTSAEEVAKTIYEAATDGTDRLRYTVGHDIPPFLKAKKEMADQDYVESMKQAYGLKN